MQIKWKMKIKICALMNEILVNDFDSSSLRCCHCWILFIFHLNVKDISAYFNSNILAIETHPSAFHLDSIVALFCCCCRRRRRRCCFAFYRSISLDWHWWMLHAQTHTAHNQNSIKWNYTTEHFVNFSLGISTATLKLGASLLSLLTISNISNVSILIRIRQ